MINDTISDLLTRIRNAGLAKESTVSVVHTKMNLEITKILQKEGFIQEFDIISNNLLAGPDASKTLLITLKYVGRAEKPVITKLKRLSSSSLRIYASYKDIPRLLNGMGIIVLSTSKGVMTDREARAQKVGGEMICSFW